MLTVNMTRVAPGATLRVMASTPREERGQRLRAARNALNFSVAVVARRSGYSESGIRALENGQNDLRPDAAEKLAPVLQVTPGWLLAGEGEGQPRPRGYPLIGKVGAGGSGLYADDYELGDAAEWIEPLPGMPQTEEIIVLDVDGDSMAPAVLDGDLAFFGPVRDDVDQLLNKRVMARLADGRKFFKILKRGTRPGVYTLRSLNPTTPDIEDVEIAWVLPYRGSKPRD